MKKPTEKDFVRWLEKQIEYYKPYLGLDLQDIRIGKENGGDNYLRIAFTYPYLDPKILYSNSIFKDFRDGKLRKDRVLHELCHALTDPLYAKAISRHTSKQEIEDERERLTDTISAIVRNLLK